MPQIKSAFKRLRQDKKKHIHNKAKLSELKTLTKKARTLISSQEKDQAETALRKLEAKLKKAAKTNTIKSGTASRRISRLRKHLHKVTK